MSPTGYAIRVILSAIFWLAAAFLIAAGLAARSAEAEDIEPTRNVQELRIRVQWIDNDSLRKAVYSEVTGVALEELRHKRVNGFSRFWTDKKGKHYCDIYADVPEEVDDRRVMTLGHELMHCFKGKYHGAE